MRPSDLLRIETLLEWRVTERGLLSPFPWSDPDDVPRFRAVRVEDAYLAYRRSGLTARVDAELAGIPARSAFEEPERVRRILGTTPPAPPRVEGHFRFPRRPAAPEFLGVARQGNHYVALEGAQPVSWAWTVREHGLAESVAVETVPEFRRRGYGRRVLAAWIDHVLSSGKLAFFAHDSHDAAAGALARSLGGVEYATSRDFF